MEGQESALDRLIEERDRREPGFAAAVEAEQAEIRAFDDVVNVVLDWLSELGWTREELAVRADLNAASLRRLLTSSSVNPTFATMMSIAEALGLRIEIREQASVEQMLAAGEVHAAAGVVSVAALAYPPVDGLGHGGSARLGAAVEHHQRGSVRVVAVEETELPVELPTLAAPHLVDTGHLPVHRFPLAAPANAGGGASRTAMTTAMTSAAGLAGSPSSHSSAGLLPLAATKKPSLHGRRAKRNLLAAFASHNNCEPGHAGFATRRRSLTEAPIGHEQRR